MKAVSHALTEEYISPYPEVFESRFRFNAQKGEWSATAPTDDSFRKTCSEARVTNLVIKGGDFSNESFALLEHEPLDRLVLESIALDAERLQIISRFSRLHGLQLYKSNQLTDALVINLTGPRNLRDLQVRDTLLTDKGLTSLVATFPLLKQIWLVRNYNMGNESLHSLEKLSKLEHLYLTECGINGSGFKYLGKCKQLRRLELTSISFKVSDFKAFNGSKLEQLVIENCQLNKEYLDSISGIKHLKSLELKNCRGITNGDIQKFREERKPRFSITRAKTPVSEEL